MIACNYSTYRGKLKEYCDKVVREGETVIVTRKDEENVVMISMEDYNYYQKAVNNWHYLLKLNRAQANLEAGHVVEMRMEELAQMLGIEENGEAQIAA